MRKLMWFTVGFGIACCLAAYGVMHSEWFLPAEIILFLLFLTGFFIPEKWRFLRRLTVSFLGCSVGFFWFLGFQHIYLSPLDRFQDSEAEVEIKASDYSVKLDYGSRIDGVLMLDGKRYQIRTYLDSDCDVQPGDRIHGRFSLELAGQEVSSYFSSKGIFLFAYEKSDVTVLEEAEPTFWCYPAILRHRMQLLLDDCFPEDAAHFAKALLLGDTSDISYATNTAFKLSGIRHIITVSGLHISILYSLVCLITLRRRFLTALAGIPVLLLFAAVAGFSPSVVRACIMIFLMLLAQLFEREYDPPTALAFSVLVMLTVNPLAAASASLQMSVACVTGILLFQKPISSWLKSRLSGYRIPSRLQLMLCSSISVTISATSLVSPLTAVYFGTVSLISLLTNLLTLWVVSLLFYGLIVVYLLWLAVPGAASFLASILAWPMRYVLFVSQILADVPMSAVYTKSVYVTAWLVFVYILLIVLLLQKKRQTGVVLCCAALSLCGALLASWAEPLIGSARITMLDVGQGQSILLQSEGKNWLVDCGGDSDTETADIVAETLLSQGISRLDGIIVTHYDRDHSGALNNLLTRIDTELLILPDTRNDFSLPESDTRLLWIWEDTEIAIGNHRIRIYGPVYSGSDNENSLCVLFDSQNCDILITGDRTGFGERMLMRHRDLPDVDILVAGHHGAADSTTEELLRAVRPETVLISVKKNNYYGHPSVDLLKRLEDFGCSVLRTDIHGTITIRR